jgi:hypothetical protein
LSSPSSTTRRVQALMNLGFPIRQARFLVHVIVFSGVFLELLGHAWIDATSWTSCDNSKAFEEDNARIVIAFASVSIAVTHVATVAGTVWFAVTSGLMT